MHTIGNLTLTGYNAELSNSAWPRKRELLSSSNLAMNRELASNDDWGLAGIAARNKQLATIALHLWPGPAENAARPFAPPASITTLRIGGSQPASADYLRSPREEFSARNPPSLTFTKVTLVLVNGENVDPSWRSLLNAILRLASREGLSLAELMQIGAMQLRKGQADDTGFSPVPGTDFSLQGRSSDDSFTSALKVAARIRVSFRVEFHWRDNQGAAFPDRSGLLQYRPALLR